MPKAADPRAFLLIHGAWQGAWVWDGLAPKLRDAGFTVDAPDLPGSQPSVGPATKVSLDSYVAFLGQRLGQIAEPVVLVAHSGGGVIASQLAEAHPGRIVGIVYLAGMMLPSGMGFAELIAEMLPTCPEAAGIGPHLVWSPDRLATTVPPEAAAQVFFHDLPHGQATAAGRRLTPQAESGRALVANLTPERFGRAPRLYVEALHDRSVVLALQRRMQALVPGADVVSLPTGHAPHVAAPDLAARSILAWVAALREPSGPAAPTLPSL